MIHSLILTLKCAYNYWLWLKINVILWEKNQSERPTTSGWIKNGLWGGRCKQSLSRQLKGEGEPSVKRVEKTAVQEEETASVKTQKPQRSKGSRTVQQQERGKCQFWDWEGRQGKPFKDLLDNAKTWEFLRNMTEIHQIVLSSETTWADIGFKHTTLVLWIY